MWRTLLSTTLPLLFVATTLSAQASGRYSLSGGLTSESLAYPSGYHLRGGVRFPVALPRTQVQLEGLFASTERRYDLVATANLVLKPVERAWAPYVIGGAGLYADSGIPLAFNGGLGIDVPVRLGIGRNAPVRDHALFVEYRGYQTHTFFSAFSIGVRR